MVYPNLLTQYQFHLWRANKVCALSKYCKGTESCFEGCNTICIYLGTNPIGMPIRSSCKILDVL